MCCSKDKLDELCELFPSTKTNIERRAMDRRIKFMEQKITKSISWRDKMKKYELDPNCQDKKPSIEDYWSDEHDPTHQDIQKEGMREYLTKQITTIETMTSALEQANK